MKSMKSFPLFECMRIRKVDPDRIVFIFVSSDGSDEKITYADLFQNTNRLSHALLKAGIGRGDAFTLLMRNHPEFLYALFAALSIGAVAVPVDPRSKGHKLAFQIKNTKSRGIIVEDDFLENIREIEKEISGAPVTGVLYKAHHKVPVCDSFPVLNGILESGDMGLPDRIVPFSAKNPVQIIHTSGTTGDPKGVVLKADRFRGYGLMNKLIWKYRNDDIPYTGLSMTHGNAQAVTVFPTLAKQNIHAVISEKFTKSRIWDICRAHGCTTFSLLGGMMSGIYNEPRRENDADNPVRRVISAGTPSAIWKDFEQRFNVRIHEWYAALEGGFAHNPPGKGPIGSFGKPNPFINRIRIVDEHDRPVRPGERGELISRRFLAKTTVSYFGKKKESEEKTRGGWLRSGDICHMDEKGFLYFDFRKGGGLRRQGDFILPDQVEKVIGEHPTVSEVCVYGIPAASGAPGECDLVAAMAPFEGGKVDVEDLKTYCMNHLERNSTPSYFQLVDEIPKSVSEKHLSRLLKDEFRPDAENVIAVNEPEK